MDTVLLVARLALAAVFAVAGLTKLADAKGGRAAMRGFGLPERLANPAAVLLPIAELAVAVLLIPVATAWYGALWALALLLAFVAGIAWNLAQGKAPDCHCFGQLHSEPVGPSTLIRNGVLAAIALFVVATGFDDAGASVLGWADDLSTAGAVGVIAGIVLFAAVAALGWALAHLLGQNGRLLLRLDALEQAMADGGVAVPAHAPAAPAVPVPGLPVGSPAPAFRLSGLHGETLTLDALRAAGKPTLLVFSDPGCGPCNALLPDLGRWERDHGGVLTVALVSRGAPEANRAKVAEHGIGRVLLQEDREVSRDYQANGTPSAVVVLADGTIGSPVAAGAEAIRQLVARTVGAPGAAVPVVRQAVPNTAAANGNGNGNRAAVPPPAPRPAAPDPNLGKPAPAIALPDLDGKPVSLADFKGNPTLVVFWNPGCGFCRRMVDDLKAWEAAPPPDAPKLLLVSSGTPEANRDLGLASPTVLDEGFAVGRAYGASGTPSAVLVDASGNLASGVAVGSPGVLALARGEDPALAAPPAPPEPVKPKIGDPAPALKLPDLSGKQLDLKAHRGTKTMVVFWNPGCGFCSRMLDDLKAWEAKPPKGSPKLLVVSTGDAETNKAMGLRSPVVLDEGFSAGRAFGASGTPSAVLVDAKGNIASEIAVGAPAVLALAGAPQDQAAVV